MRLANSMSREKMLAKISSHDSRVPSIDVAGLAVSVGAWAKSKMEGDRSGDRQYDSER